MLRGYSRDVSVGLAAAVLAWAGAGCGSQPRPPVSGKNALAEEIEVALLIDLSGSQHTLGEPAMKGFELAVREGATDSSPRISVTTIDTRTDDAATKRAAEELAPRVTGGAGFTNNESLLVAGPVFQKERKPFLSIGATDPALPEVVGDCIFLVCFGDNTQAAAAAEFALREFGGTTAIVWDSTTPYTRTLPKYFRTRFEELEGRVLLDAPYQGCDLTELGKKISALPQSPGSVYLAAMPDCAGELIASLRAAGIDAPIVGGDGLDTPNVLKSESGPTSGVWFTTHAWLSAETGTAQARAFVQAYDQAYGAPPSDAFAALGYDAGTLLLDAIRRAAGDSPEQIAAALEATRDFEGVTGKISYGAGQHVPGKTVWIVHVQNGKKSLAASSAPARVPPPMVPRE